MYKFSQVYDLSRRLLAAKCFKKWSDHYQSKLEALFADGGPAEGQSEVLNELRDTLSRQPPSAIKLRNQPAPKPPTAEDLANLVIRYAKLSQEDPTKGFDDRAAFLKMLKHFYFVSRAGGQVVWVADSPSAYSKYTYDLFKGKTERSIADACKQNNEVFGESGRKLFSDALSLARKWSMDAYTKLSAPDELTKKVAKRWFLSENDSDLDLDHFCKTLMGQFKLISSACNDTRIIFADDPIERTNRKRDPYAATHYEGHEKMRVIYISKPYLELAKQNRDGSMPKLWHAAKTIIHELAHKELGAEDKRYGWKGIKPGMKPGPKRGEQEAFEVFETLTNADSYGYFAVDLAGALAAADFREAYR